MHRLAIKRTTKNELPPASQYTRNDVRTAASRHSAVRCDRRYVCRDCQVPTAVHVHRGVRTANLHAVRSAITATAELLVIFSRPSVRLLLSPLYVIHEIAILMLHK